MFTQSVAFVKLWRSARLVRFCGLVAALFLFGAYTAQAEVNLKTVAEVRTLYPSEWGVGHPSGLAYSANFNQFFLIEKGTDTQPMVVVLSPYEDLVARVPLQTTVADVINITFDDTANRLFLLNSDLTQLIQVKMGSNGRLDPNSETQVNIASIGLQSAQGMTVDAKGKFLFVLDSVGTQVVRIKLKGSMAQPEFNKFKLPPGSDLINTRGIALNPSNRHLYAIHTTGQILYELDQSGKLIAKYDLAGLQLTAPRALTYAPSPDLTDNSSTVHLFIADSQLLVSQAASAEASEPSLLYKLYLSVIADAVPAGVDTSEGVDTAATQQAVYGKIVEVALDVAATEVSAASTNVTTLTLVRTILTSQFSPPSPDPSGLAYLPASGTLLIGDGEVDEMPPYYAGKTLFNTTLPGVLVGTFPTTFSDEPVGVDVNPVNNHLFISDDTGTRTVYELNPGSDGLYATADDIVTSFKTGVFNSTDPEGLAYDPSGTGILYISDGVNRELYRVAPGANGIFDGIPTTGDDTVTHFDTLSLGLDDPEGIAFNPVTGNVYMVGKPATTLFELTTAGALVQTYNIAAANARKPAGLAYGPSSQDPTQASIYIAARGVDNDSDPNENDGKIYEFLLGQPFATPTVPAAPSSLVATGAGQTQIDLSWVDNSTNEDGFKIERSPDGASGWTQIGTVTANATSYANTGLTCGTTYFYRVRAYNASGDSADSNPANAPTTACPPTVPAAPSSLVATGAGQTQIDLSWVDNSTNEDGFKIERSSDGASDWTQIGTVTANAISYANTGLTCGTTYFYRVRAYNAGGDSAYSNPANAPTTACPPTVPAAPSSLVATGAGQTQIDLSWVDNSANEDGFKIERSSDGASDWTQIGTVTANATSYANTGLTCGTTYFYRVRAYNASGDSADSNPANAPTTACPPTVPAAPSGLGATGAGQTQIDLSWVDNSTNEDGFKIERSPDGASGWTQIGTATANAISYANTGLTCGTTYFYRVRAYNASGDSAYSNPANAPTTACPPTVPAAPSSLVATGAGQTQIDLSWVDNSANEDGFKIERSSDGASDWTQIGTVTANAISYANTGLTCATTYFYRMHAYNASGDSAYSNPANAPTTACPPLINFRLSVASNGTVGTVAASDEDILEFNGTNYTLLFDGSAVGVGGGDVDAFYFVDADTILMSFEGSMTIGALGTVADSDIVRFDASALGLNTTAGSFSMYFDGSDVGLSSSDEDIDAMDLLADGRLLISTVGNVSVPGVSGADEDLLAFTPTTLGAATSGAWALYFDGSDVGLSSSGEDVDGVSVANGKIYLTTRESFAVTGVSGADEDIFVCTPTSLGPTTACTYAPTLFFDGSLWGLGGNDLDGIGLIKGGQQAAAAALVALQAVEKPGVADDPSAELAEQPEEVAESAEQPEEVAEPAEQPEEIAEPVQDQRIFLPVVSR